MTDDFATAMRRALEKTCAQDPGAATAIIQSALAGKPPADADGGDCAPCAAFASLGKGMGGGGRRGGNPAGLSGLAGLGEPQRMPHLNGLSGLPGAARPVRTAPVPDGGRVESRRHAGPAGAREYRLFVPSPRDEGLAGLVIMLHGCTQSPEDFALGTRMDFAAEKAGFIVAYPGQTGRHNAQSCWNWFRPEDQARTGGEAPDWPWRSPPSSSFPAGSTPRASPRAGRWRRCWPRPIPTSSPP